MLRALAYLIFAILFIGILRSVIGMFARLFTNATAGPQRQPDRPRSQSAGQVLKKDPVCGTFVAESTGLQKVKDGQVFYFCSAACRDKF